MDISIQKKAELLEAGGVTVDSSFMPFKSKATAGPGAGLESIFVNIGGHRVRLGVKQASKFNAVLDGEDVTIFREGKEFARGRLEQAITHCPRQIYITVSERCVFDCKFCPVPKLQGKVKSDEEVLRMVRDGLHRPELLAISMTSGVWKTPEEEAQKVARLIRLIRNEPGTKDVPIGVSVYPAPGSSELLKEAGAAEIKYNVETMDPEVFRKVCPGLKLDYIIESLEHAVGVFGRDHVFSNFLVGMGETDEAVIDGIELLASKGVITILRKVNPHPLRAGEISLQPASAARLLKLASESRRIYEKYGLHPEKALTGCLPCTGCDVTPMLDV
jgi:biotin synthase-related radical SAM superfamily protein